MMTSAASRKTHLDPIMIGLCQVGNTFVTFQPMGIFRFWRNGEFTFFPKRSTAALSLSQSPSALPSQMGIFRFWSNGEFTFFPKMSTAALSLSQSPSALPSQMGIYRFWRNGEFTFFKRCLQPLYLYLSPHRPYHSQDYRFCWHPVLSQFCPRVQSSNKKIYYEKIEGCEQSKDRLLYKVNPLYAWFLLQ